MTALEREDGATQALEELEATKDTSADGVLRVANGHLDACDLRGDIRASVDEMTVTAPLVEKATDPMVQSSALNTYAATLVLLGRYGEAHGVATQASSKLADEYRLEFVKPHANLASSCRPLGYARVQAIHRNSSRRCASRAGTTDSFS